MLKKLGLADAKGISVEIVFSIYYLLGKEQAIWGWNGNFYSKSCVLVTRVHIWFLRIMEFSSEEEIFENKISVCLSRSYLYALLWNR